MEKLYIVIPAYNEQDNIQQVIEQWYPIVERIGDDCRLVIVNDGSKDNTYKIMQDCAVDRPQFIPLTKENSGHGATVLYAYHYALDHNTDYVFQTDSDGQTEPEEFWSFWKQRGDYDMVIGNRSSRQDGISRIFVTKTLKMTLRICFGVTVTDANTPFRLMKAETLKKNIELIPDNFNLSNVILSVIYEKKKQRVKYVPITFKERQGGENSINFRKIVGIGARAVKDFRIINNSFEGEAVDLKKKISGKISVLFCLLFIAFVLSMKSGFDYFSRGGTNAKDGDVFNCIGWLMRQGYVPYRDIFDHKGMFLYFLQYIGHFFGQYRGIYVVEVFFLTASVFVCYIIARKFSNRIISILVVLLVFARYSDCGYGNCAEEYSVLFQIIALYYFLDFFEDTKKYVIDSDQQADNPAKKNNWLDLRVITTGVGFACTFFMKANFCAIWVVFCIAIAIFCIQRKYWRTLVKFIFSFGVGILAVTVPIVIYLLKNEAMQDFVYDYFVFNRLYTSNASRVTLKSLVNSIVTFSNTVPFIASFLIMIFEIKKKDKYFVFNIICFILIIVSLLFVTMSGQTYRKMEIALLPAYVYPFSRLANRLDSTDWKRGHISMIIIGYFVIAFIYPSWSSLVNNASSDVSKHISSPDSKGFHDNEIVKYIKEHTDEEDVISVLGNECRIYLYSNRLPNSKYIFLPDPRVDSSITKEYFEELRKNPPKIIVISSKYTTGDRAYVGDEMNDFLEEYGYELVLDGDKPVYQQLSVWE